jgi:chorismate dehydratase
MTDRSESKELKKIRLGAVTYLNTRPLTFSLSDLLPHAEIIYDYPSRLAEALDAGRLDVATIPSIEYARNLGYTIVSDACIACDGPVRSVKLFGRVPVEDIHTIALDEGSRTSAALSLLLLMERFGVSPKTIPLPIGVSLTDVSADAVLMIGDRGMTPSNGAFEFVWDLGEEWARWTGLPFVFSLWVARPNVDLGDVDKKLASARDLGLTRLAEIAKIEAPKIGIPEEDCLAYLRDHLEFRLGQRQRRGLEYFFELAWRHGFIPAKTNLAFYGG